MKHSIHITELDGARVYLSHRGKGEFAAQLESRARRLYALRLIDPRAVHYAMADALMEQARAIRAHKN